MSISTLLVVRAQTGDRSALNELLTLLQAPLYAHIVGVLGDETGADDVLQNVLLIIARKLGSVREPKWARAWAYRIANREAVRAARRARRYDEVALPDFPVEPDQAESYSPPEEDPGLLAMLDALPPAAQAVIRLHYLDELSLAEISEALEIPLGTVKSRLAYGLRSLRSKSRS